jgi:hypothetical protein
MQQEIRITLQMDARITTGWLADAIKQAADGLDVTVLKIEEEGEIYNPPAGTIIIQVEGGSVTQVHSTMDMEVIVRDLDNIRERDAHDPCPDGIPEGYIALEC